MIRGDYWEEDSRKRTRPRVRETERKKSRTWGRRRKEEEFSWVPSG
jgi:hypothetical protein